MADDKSNGTVAALEFKNSVKKDEYSKNAGLFNYLIPAYGYNGRDYVALPQYLPPSTAGFMYHTSRDMTLMSTIEHEAIWSNAVNIAVQKAAAWGWEVTSEIALRQKRAQELIQDYEWLGVADYTTAISAHLKGYLLTGRAFVEIERATSSRFSKIVALHHLDPMSCSLTGDPRKPVNYMDTKGHIHELNDYEVGIFVMNPSPIERPYLHNTRPYQSPTESVYDQITQMEAIWRYLYEKTTGKRALSIDFITGIATKQMQDIVVSADADMERKGTTLYKGSILVPIAQADAGVSHVRIDLAGLPDGFDFQKIYDNTVISYASALGLDVNDLDPRLAQKQNLGSGTQATLLDSKTQTKGLVIWRQQFAKFLNRMVLDDATVFSWRERSTDERTKEAEMNGKIVNNVKTMIEAQIITNQQGLNILVDEEVLPREFLDVDVTQANSIGDDEKDIAQPRDPNAPKPAQQPQDSEIIPQGDNQAQPAQSSNGGDSIPATQGEKEYRGLRFKHIPGRHNQKNHGNRGGIPAKGSDKYNAQQITQSTSSQQVTTQPKQSTPSKESNESAKKFVKAPAFMKDKTRYDDSVFEDDMPGGGKDVDIFDLSHNAYNYTDKETGIKAEVSGISPLFGEKGILVKGDVRDKNGEKIGYFTRIVKPDGSVEHEVFELNENVQGSGFGGRFYQNQEQAYIASGVINKVELQANLTVGGYAWARMGVDFDEPAMAQQFAENFSTRYKKEYGTYPPVFPEHSWEIAAYKGPDGRSIGKEFMLGSNWNGVKNLSQDSVGYQIGQQYYGSK